MRGEMRSQDKQQRARGRVTTRAFWFPLLFAVALIAAWPVRAQAPNSANELARVLEASLRAKDLDTAAKHVSPPTIAKAFVRVLEARLGKFRDLQKLRVYVVPEGAKVAEEKAASDFQKRGARFVPLKTEMDKMKIMVKSWPVAPVGQLVVLDDTEIFTVMYGDSGGRSVFTFPETR